MKRAFRLCAALAILACSLTAVHPASAVVNDNNCDNTRCNLFCQETGHASGHCVIGACHCFG